MLVKLAPDVSIYLGPAGGFNRDLRLGMVCCLSAISLFCSDVDDDRGVRESDPPNSRSSGLRSSEMFLRLASHFSANRSIDPCSLSDEASFENVFWKKIRVLV